MIIKRLAGLTLSIAATLTLSTAFISQAVATDIKNYPNGPIRLVVPFPPGGGSDTVGRLFGSKLSEKLGKPVIVENKSGASGAIGAGIVANANPDGLTLLLGTTPLIQAPVFYKNLPYKAFDDFEPVARLALSADVLIVPSDSGITNVEQFVEKVKNEGGKLSYGSYGNATSAHMHGELLKHQKGLDLLHVPYKGTGPLMQDFLGNNINSAFAEIVGLRPHLDNEKVRPLAISGEQRLKLLPEVPTFTELGYPDFEPNGWYGLLVPASTPTEIIELLSTTMEDIVAMPDVQNTLQNIGLTPGYGSAEQLKEWMQRDALIWEKMAKLGNITVQE